MSDKDAKERLGSVRSAPEPKPVPTAPSPPLDHDLLRRACQNDGEAWQSMYRHLNSSFYELAARRVVKRARYQGTEARRQTVDDLVQSVWAHIVGNCQNLERHFDPNRGSLSGFLVTVANNHISDQLRKVEQSGRREVELDGHAEPEATQASPEEQLEIKGDLDKIDQILRHKMNPRDRELLMRVCVGDESTSTISEEEGVPRNTIDQRLSRARRELRGWLSGLRSGTRKN